MAIRRTTGMFFALTRFLSPSNSRSCFLLKAASATRPNFPFHKPKKSVVCGAKNQLLPLHGFLLSGFNDHQLVVLLLDSSLSCWPTFLRFFDFVKQGHDSFGLVWFCEHLILLAFYDWVLCEHVIVHTILGGSPVILWISLGGKPKWLPLKFGYHDVMPTSPI